MAVGVWRRLQEFFLSLSVDPDQRARHGNFGRVFSARAANQSAFGREVQEYRGIDCRRKGRMVASVQEAGKKPVFSYRGYQKLGFWSALNGCQFEKTDLDFVG